MYWSQYQEVLLTNHDITGTNKFDLGKTDTLLHEISLKTEYVYIKQFKIPDAHCQDVERHIAEWLKLGVIQPTKSPLNSPIFTVAKKNGGIRLVQDFCMLNAHTHTNKYSMKDVGECISNMGC
jgi:hypothetical protein